MFRNEFQRFQRNHPHTTTKYLFQIRYDPGTDIMKEDWDNLILLDALRYDSLKQSEFINSHSGELCKISSHGCKSIEFLRENFAGEEYHDTVYITANPHIQRLEQGIFHKVIKVYDQWDDKYQTVLPEDVVDAAVSAYEEYPHKRLLVHFMQPHAPFLGPTGEHIQEEYGIRGWGDKYIDSSDMDLDQDKVVTAARKGEIPRSLFRKGYEENVEIALEHTANLLKEIDGKTVVTSDHAELVGERLFMKRRYGHGNFHTKALCNVPYFILEFDIRRDVHQDPPVFYEETDEEILQDRLRMLGYK